MILRKLLHNHGVGSLGFARIMNKGDFILFGGYTTLQMKKKLNIPENRPLADFLPNVILEAKDFAAEITKFNVRKNDLSGEKKISSEHMKNNKDVREMLLKSNIKPEELPPEKDKKIAANN